MARSVNKVATEDGPGAGPVSIWRRQCAGLCFAALGGLAAIQNGGGFGAVVVGIVLGAGFGMGIVWLLPRLTKRFGGEALAEQGDAQLKSLVLQAAPMLIPFTVLAVLSKLVFGWNAVVPFASAALMAFSAVATAEMAKRETSKRVSLMLVSVGTPFLLGTVWTLLASSLR